MSVLVVMPRLEQPLPARKCPFYTLHMAMDLTMVASTMAYSMSGSSEQAWKSLTKTSAFKPIAIALEGYVPVPEKGRKVVPGISRPRDPQHRFNEAAIGTATAPWVSWLTKQCGSIFAH